MRLDRSFFATLFMLLAIVFFVWLALIEGKAITSADTWQQGAGLASMALSFMIWGAAWWNRGNTVP